MTFDYISDLHIDFLYKPSTKITSTTIKHNFSKVFKTKSSDYLLVAGDISESPDTTFNFLKCVKETFGYKKILLVFGNHDMWLSSRTMSEKFNYDSYNKVNYFKNWLMRLDKEKDIVLLDGDVVDIEGVKIGGAMGWYDTTYDAECIQPYLSPYSDTPVNIFTFWSQYMTDYKYVLPQRATLKNLIDTEHAKVLKVLESNPDIVLTHICPVIGDEFVHPKYSGDRLNTFYQMDFREHIKNTKPKVWVYGHQHNVAEYTYGDTKLLLNPYGYPSENLKTTVKSFEV